METTQRLFFALWPPLELAACLYALNAAQLKNKSACPVATENIHLTLAFLGNVNTPAQDRFEQAASEVRAARFTLELDWLDCWPRARIAWAGASNAPVAMSQLVRSLNECLTARGYQPDTRPFTPHLTLARHVHPCLLPRAIDTLKWDVDRFHLARSQTAAMGVRYEILRSWGLDQSA